MQWSRLSVALIILLGLGGCPDPSSKVDIATKPALGAEPNTMEPQWVLQHTPPAKAAVVFIHGIFGDAIGTWTSDSGTSFFQLLKDDPHLGAELDLFAFGYTSKMLSGSSFTIQEAANKLHERLKYHGVLNSPAIVFVAHSMGGLVVLRELLTHRELIPRVALIVFYSTPQEGAQITTIARHVSANRALEDMLPANRNSYLQSLNDEWKEARKIGGPPVICGYEKQKTHGILVVPWDSATRFCDGTALPIDANHITIAKPDRAGHDSIVLLVNALNEHVIGKQFVARLELPDFVREADRWTYTLRAALGKQPARIVNSGRLPLRYTIAEPSDPGLYIWPDDTPRTLQGGSQESVKFALAHGATLNEYRFVLRSDAAEDQAVTVRVPDVPNAQAQLAELTGKVAEDLNILLSSEDGRLGFASAAPDDPRVPQLVVEHARLTIAREMPDAPISLQWVITADVLGAANWPTLAIEALRNAEKNSPAVVNLLSVQSLAATTAVASGESQIFANVASQVLTPERIPAANAKLPAGISREVAAQLAETLRSIPALRASGLSLEGDLQQSRGDSDAARRAYAEAAQIRLTPSLSERIRVLAVPAAEAGVAGPRASTTTAVPEVQSAVIVDWRVLKEANNELRSAKPGPETRKSEIVVPSQ